MSIEILREFSGYSVSGLMAENDGDVAIYYACKELLPQAEGICMDVGADKGAWTEMIRTVDRQRTCHVFEPNPESFSALVTRFEDKENIFLHSCAISNREGHATMNLAGPQSRIDLSGSVVETETLDSFLDPNEKIAIVKIDTEGHDDKILASLHQLLKEDRIHTIVSEWTPYWYGDNYVEQYTNSKNVLENIIPFFPYMYSLSRRGAPYCVLINPDDIDDFLEEHLMDNLQTDILFSKVGLKGIPCVPYEANMWYA